MSTSDGPVLIALSPSELATKTLTTQTLQRALRALHADGLRDAAVLAARPGTHHTTSAPRRGTSSRSRRRRRRWCLGTSSRIPANTAFKAGGRQPVHIDLDCPFPGEMAFGLCVNVCLGDVGVENGATEVWLGSHLGTGWGSVGRGEHAEAIDEGLVEERRKDVACGDAEFDGCAEGDVGDDSLRAVVEE
ncbi:hypothetical protein GTA08_BOTSDO07198 [Botryosphaeria dothidea]|uniref:Uncharacterized protein n=1 Tax=Botryosphaeria dothidea TaxID=55169 RepID=A0A8H4ITC1_9PEZI|nr:hypothetical protein GTA08_BOTSDO07198 [Botryosphaeria dothidea]